MTTMLYSPILDVRASTGIVSHYTDVEVQTDKIASDILLNMFLSDEVIARAIDLTVEHSTSAGYSIIGKNKQLKDKAVRKLDELCLKRELKKIVYSGMIFAQAYEEKRRIGSEINELWNLESSETFISYDKHGTINYFVQNPDTEKEVKFPKDKVLFFPFRQFGSRVYSYEPLQNISKSYAILIQAKNWLHRALTNNPPRMLFHMQGANSTQRASFIENLRRSKVNSHMDVVTYGSENSKITTESLGTQFDEKILKILSDAREQVLMIWGVPQVWCGMVDGENRGISESQERPFYVKLESLHQNIEDVINRDLMPDLGFGTLKFKFNNPSPKSVQTVLEQAERMKNTGVKPERISRFLTENRVFIDEEDFYSPEEVLQNSGKSEDMYESRKRENKDSSDMKSNIDQSGVSKAGGKKIEQRAKV